MGLFEYGNKKRTKRLPMRRNVYLMERTTGKTWKSILLFKREIKIGIAKNSKERHQTVNNGISGHVVILESYRINRASTIEAELHKRYASKNFTIKDAKKNSGATEFFRLSNSEIRDIKELLREKSGQKNELPFYLRLIIITIICVLIMYLRQ